MVVQHRPMKLDHENPEPMLRQYFREVAAQFSSRYLLIDEATDAVNRMLRKFGIAYVVSGDEFEGVLLSITADIEVCEDTFVHAYSKILTFAGLGAEDRLVDLYMKFFNKFMRGRETTRVLYATRVLRRAWKNNRNTGLLVAWPIPDESIMKQNIHRFDRDGDGKLNRLEFVCAALSIVHGINKNFDDEILEKCRAKEEVCFPFEFELVVV